MESSNKNYKKLNVEKCLSLIKAIEAQPVVWQKNMKEFKNKRKQEIAWTEIAKQENCSVEEAKNQWKVLLSCFRTYKSKVKKHLRNAANSDEVYRPRWFAFKAMMFLSDPAEVAELNTIFAVRSILPKGSKSPEPGTSQQHKYMLDESSCSQFSLPAISMDSFSPGTVSLKIASAHSVGENLIDAEDTSDQQLKDPLKVDATMALSAKHVFDRTSQQQSMTSAVIANDVARWIETFEPRQKNLVIGNLYLAMHQIEQDLSSK